MSIEKPHRLLIVIPARSNSARLPNKLLLDLHGKPLLYWTVKRVLETGLADVIVATDSVEIMTMCENFGFPVIQTSVNCVNGTERVFEVASILQEKYELFMNVQGDEPLLNVDIIKSLLATIGTNDQAFKVAVSAIENTGENNPSEVKVALSNGGRVRYASRAPIPFSRVSDHHFYKIHGVYLYTYQVLKRFVNSPEGPLEAYEKVEQLRCIENDIPIYAVVTAHTPNSVDTKVDFDHYQNLNPEAFSLISI